MATATEAPRSRRYKFRANAKCGKIGDPNATPGFTGVCNAYEGDEFFLTLHPVRAKARDADGKVIRGPNGKPKMVLVERAMPTWADALAEYPIEKPVQPLRILAGSAQVPGGLAAALNPQPQPT